jgi:uncharacterized protein YjeT (DUF2065 family)
MSRAAISIVAFGIYLVVLGIGLLLFPDALLALFGQPPTNEPWLRVVGLVVLVLGIYYLNAAREEVTAFFRWTLVGRPLAVVALAVLVASGHAPAFVLILAAIDAVCTAWTWKALQIDRRR